MDWQQTPVSFTDSGATVDIPDKKQFIQYLEKNDRLVLGHGKERITLNLRGNQQNDPAKSASGAAFQG